MQMVGFKGGRGEAPYIINQISDIIDHISLIIYHIS